MESLVRLLFEGSWYLLNMAFVFWITQRLEIDPKVVTRFLFRFSLALLLITVVWGLLL